MDEDLKIILSDIRDDQRATREDISALREDVQALQRWKSWVNGAWAAASAVISAVVAWIFGSR